MNLESIKQSISPKEYQEVERLLSFSNNDPLELEDIWKMIDTVWNELGCDCNRINEYNISKFYRHPVWLLNGFFIEEHALSIQHRNTIADWVVNNANVTRILDYGGGFGTLARFISDKNGCLQIDIYEPFPHQYALIQVEPYSNVNFVDSIISEYDCLVSTDVLEHVPDPLRLLSEMIDSVRNNGYLIIGNCFYPVIKCHLPSTFHLRYTFNQLAKIMGLRFVCRCGDSHALIYQKIHSKPFNWFLIRLFEYLSKVIFPILQNPNFLQIVLSIKNYIYKTLNL